MKDYKIGFIVGSLRLDSFNKKLAHAVAKLLPSNFKVTFVEIKDLPLYNQDADANVPSVVAQYKSALEQQDAIVIVTPEYNRSIPGVLKNALDQASRPWGSNSLNSKPTGILGTSPGNAGTAMAQQHLRNVLSFLNMPTMMQPEAFIKWSDDMVNADGSFSEHTKAFVQGWVDAYVAWVEQRIA